MDENPPPLFLFYSPKPPIHFKDCQCGEETTKYAKNTKGRYAQDCQNGLETTKYTKYTKKGLHVERKPQNTQNTQKKGLHVD